MCRLWEPGIHTTRTLPSYGAYNISILVFSLLSLHCTQNTKHKSSAGTMQVTSHPAHHFPLAATRRCSQSWRSSSSRGIHASAVSTNQHNAIHASNLYRTCNGRSKHAATRNTLHAAAAAAAPGKAAGSRRNQLLNFQNTCNTPQHKTEADAARTLSAAQP